MKAPKTQRVLTPLALSNSGLTVIDEYHDDKVDIIVYEDGSVDYSQHYQGCKARRTVFDLRDTAKYQSPDGVKIEVNLTNEDALIAITLYGDERILNNSEKVEAKYTQGYVGTEASRDFAEELISKMTYRDTLTRLYKAIETLTPAQQKVIYLYYFQGWKEQPIADKLGIVRTSVSDRRRLALNQLRKYLI